MGEVWVDGVYCQRFGQIGALQRLFKVVPASGVEAGAGSDAGSGTQKAIEAMFAASAQAIKEKDEAAAALIGD